MKKSTSSASSKKKLQEQIQQMKKNRLNKQLEPKTFFQLLIPDSNYVEIPEANEFIENLMLMTENRKEDNIFLLTS